MKPTLAEFQEHFTSDFKNEGYEDELSNLANEFYNDCKELPEYEFYKRLESSPLMIKYNLYSKRIMLQNSIKTTKNITNIRNIVVFYFVLFLLGAIVYLFSLSQTQ